MHTDYTDLEEEKEDFWNTNYTKETPKEETRKAEGTNGLRKLVEKKREKKEKEEAVFNHGFHGAA